MRKTGSFLLAACALIVHFSATYSYVHGPLRSSRFQSNSCKIQEVFYKSLSGSKSIVPPSARENLQIFCSGDNDQPSTRTSEPTLLKRLIGKLKGPATAILTACAFFMIGMRSASARPPKSSKTISSPEKSTVKQSNNARQSSKTKQTPKVAEVELVIQKKGGLNSQLSRVGFVLVGVSTVGTLLSGDDKKKAKKSAVVKQPKKSVMKPTINWPIEIDEEEPEVLPPKKKPPTIPRRVRNGLNARNALPTAEDLFPNSEEADLFFEVKPEDADLGDDDVSENVVKKSKKISLPPSKMKRVEISEESLESDVEEADRIKEAIINKAPEKSLPQAEPAKKSIFDRIFQKRSTSRPTDLRDVLRVEDAASSFRAATATVLTFYLPSRLKAFSDVEPGGMLSYSVDEKALSDSEDMRVSTLMSLKNDLALEPKEAADAFADVTNAMLVSLTDVCVDSLDIKSKSTEETEKATILALNTLADFALAAGTLFGKILPGVIVEDGGIKYNGKAQKAKLETLYYNAMIADDQSGLISNLMKGLTAAAAAGEEGAEAAPFEEPDTEALERESALQDTRLQCLQQLFAISEGKRGSLESKATNYKIMNMMGGQGKGGNLDLSALMGNMGKKGPMGMGMGPEGMPDMSGMGDIDQATFDKMMKEAAKNAGTEGVPDPVEMAAMMKDAVAGMEAQLAAGKVTKAEVAEFEGSLGMGLKEMIGLIDVAKKFSSQPIPELNQMLKLFKELQAIRNS